MMPTPLFGREFAAARAADLVAAGGAPRRPRRRRRSVRIAVGARLVVAGRRLLGEVVPGDPEGVPQGMPEGVSVR